MNAETRTRWYVAIAGVLDLLPTGLDTKWDKSGKVVESTMLNRPWENGVQPTVRYRKPKVWVIKEG